MEHPGHLYEVTISGQALEHRLIAAQFCVDLCLWPTARFASFEPHGVGIPGDPHGWLLQAGPDHVGTHGGIQKQAGPQAGLQPAGFTADEAAPEGPKMPARCRSSRPVRMPFGSA